MSTVLRKNGRYIHSNSTAIADQDDFWWVMRWDSECDHEVGDIVGHKVATGQCNAIGGGGIMASPARIRYTVPLTLWSGVDCQGSKTLMTTRSDFCNILHFGTFTVTPFDRLNPDTLELDPQI